MFFHLLPGAAIIIDNNWELINFYTIVRDQLPALLADLKRHINDKEYYYRLRALDADKMDPVRRASRFLYFNKTGYNGLWRVNKKGKYNVPFGRYKNPKIVDRENLPLVSRVLQHCKIISGDFSQALGFAQPGTFVYLDPPYHPLSATANFTSYTADSFGVGDQERLAQVFKKLDQKGCRVMLSNSDTPFTRRLYTGYDLQVVYARRAINCQGGKRGPVPELVIRNYL